MTTNVLKKFLTEQTKDNTVIFLNFGGSEENLMHAVDQGKAVFFSCVSAEEELHRNGLPS